MHYKLTVPARGPYGPRSATYDARMGFLQILVVSILLRSRKGAVRHACGSRTGPVRIRQDMKNIWDSRAGPVRRPCVVLRIIRSNHKCTAVSSRTGPVAWCDHENSTGVKFRRALHSPLRARNRTGAKIVPYGARGWVWLRHYPLACGSFDSNFRSVNPEHMVRNKLMVTRCEYALRWMPQNNFDYESTFV